MRGKYALFRRFLGSQRALDSVVWDVTDIQALADHDTSKHMGILTSIYLGRCR